MSSITRGDDNFDSKTGAGALSIENLFHLQDQKPADSSGGTFTSGVWIKRDINTALTNNILGASFDSGNKQFTLPIGDYMIVDGRASTHRVDRHSIRLRDITASVNRLVGHGSFSNAADSTSTDANISGKFSISQETVFELQHRCQTTHTTNGFGLDVGVARGIDHEVFLNLEIYKVG